MESGPFLFLDCCQGYMVSGSCGPLVFAFAAILIRLFFL
jgi:hypothetical protein